MNRIPGESFPQQERSGEDIKPTETSFDLEGEKFTFATYNIGKVKEYENPGIMNTGRETEVMKLYKDNPLLVSQNIPYTWLDSADGRIFGDYSTPEGQNEFKNSDLTVSDEGFRPPEWAADLWRFVALKQARSFTLDETLACLRGVEVKKDHLRFTVGPGLYSQGFYSMGSEGERLQITEDERRILSGRVSSEHIAELDELLGKLQSLYSVDRQIRDIIVYKMGGLPSYNNQVYSSILGVAGTVLTESGDYVLVRRGKNVSVNLGINVTASGGVGFDREALSRYGLPHHLGTEMHRESKEEIGLKSGVLLLGAMQERIQLELGVEQNDYELIPVGFARELMRGGSPEAMFLIRYKGTTEDLIRTVANKKDVITGEVDELMYAIPAERASQLIKKQGASSVIQHKGVLNLMMMDRYLKNNS